MLAVLGLVLELVLELELELELEESSTRTRSDTQLSHSKQAHTQYISSRSCCRGPSSLRGNDVSINRKVTIFTTMPAPYVAIQLQIQIQIGLRYVSMQCQIQDSSPAPDGRGALPPGHTWRAGNQAAEEVAGRSANTRHACV